MFLGPIAPQSIPCDLKLLGPIPKAHEPQDPQQNPYRLRRHHLHGPDINRLRVVPQPVTKVDALDVHFAELLARPAANQQREQRVFDVAVAPVLALDRAQTRDVAGAEGGGGAGPEDEEDKAGQPYVADVEGRRHCGGRVF